VITAMQMDRQLAPTRPYNTVLRPSDGKVPDNIAFVLCAGSRDCQVGNDLCSRVCCMYTIKQAQLIMGALPLADVTIYYIDIRAFGKGFEEFYQQSKAMGVSFVKGKVTKKTASPAARALTTGGSMKPAVTSSGASGAIKTSAIVPSILSSRISTAPLSKAV